MKLLLAFLLVCISTFLAPFSVLALHGASSSVDEPLSQFEAGRDLQTCSNPETKSKRECKRKWYWPWEKDCKNVSKKCYSVHKYGYSCYGLLAVETLYYPKDCNFRNIGSFSQYDVCFGFEFGKSGCFDSSGNKTPNCPSAWTTSDLHKEICD